MFARRFTIVFLLLTLFGMLFSMLVAETARSSLARGRGRALPLQGRAALPAARARLAA